MTRDEIELLVREADLTEEGGGYDVEENWIGHTEVNQSAVVQLVIDCIHRHAEDVLKELKI